MYVLYFLKSWWTQTNKSSYFYAEVIIFVLHIGFVQKLITYAILHLYNCQILRADGRILRIRTPPFPTIEKNKFWLNLCNVVATSPLASSLVSIFLGNKVVVVMLLWRLTHLQAVKSMYMNWSGQLAIRGHVETFSSICLEFREIWRKMVRFFLYILKCS